ncbi:MAG: IclR family transcriptional regulator [Thermodesulfobacteriota bacterium]|jgi:DNA-binding IclR family transcriptional regulator|nr:IclR family transcriptional regulator [Thermodesulfobacteriota bacterium]
MMPARDKETYCIRSVENALALLEALGEEEDELSLSRLSERLGMNKASVFRLLATFESRGYVERKEGARGYCLGPLAYEIGQKLLSRMTLLRKARPVMERLARECSEAVYLVLRRQEEALFIDMVDSSHQVKVISLVGKRFPLRDCAAGRVLLAFAEPLLSEPGHGCGPAASVDDDIQIVRRQGACYDHHGVGEGSACVAVPLFAGGGSVVGALAVIGPDFRITPEVVDSTLLPAMCAAADTINSKLGYLGVEFSSEGVH